MEFKLLVDDQQLVRVLAEILPKYQNYQNTEQPQIAVAHSVNGHSANMAGMSRAKDQPPDAGEAAKIARLTEREREVVTVLCEGLRNQQIADRLCISVITVRHHLSSIFSKLEVIDRFELAFYSYRHGLAKLPM